MGLEKVLKTEPLGNKLKVTKKASRRQLLLVLYSPFSGPIMLCSNIPNPTYFFCYERAQSKFHAGSGAITSPLAGGKNWSQFLNNPITPVCHRQKYGFPFRQLLLLCAARRHFQLVNDLCYTGRNLTFHPGLSKYQRTPFYHHGACAAVREVSIHMPESNLQIPKLNFYKLYSFTEDESC